MVVYAQEHAPEGKPARACFATVLSRLDVAAPQAVFIGDHPEKDVAGAAAAGLRPIWLPGVAATSPRWAPRPSHGASPRCRNWWHGCWRHLMSLPAEIAGQSIATGGPMRVIAEIGLNHAGDADSAHRLVDACADAGAWAVKFQVFEARELLVA